MLSLIAGGLIFTIRVATSSGTDADAETGGVVVLGGLRIAVQRQIPGYDLPNATVWEARPAPEPMFDTSSLGPDRSFTPGKPSVAALAGLEGDVVYLGDHEGAPMILHARAAPRRNPWDHIYTFVMGRGDRRLVDATFPCCAFSYGDDGTIDPQMDWPIPGNPIVQWLGTPASTSIVAVAVDGEPIGFQRPSGGIVTMDLGVSPPFPVTFTAFDASGDVLATKVFRFEPVVLDTDDPSLTLQATIERGSDACEFAITFPRGGANGPNVDNDERERIHAAAMSLPA